MTFVTWALPILGATLIITCSSLFGPLRRATTGWRHELVSCPMCLGFWVGLGASLLGLSLVPMPTVLSTAFPQLWIRLVELGLQLFGNGCAAAWVCWTAHVILCRLGQGRLLSSRPDPSDNPYEEQMLGRMTTPRTYIAKKEDFSPDDSRRGVFDSVMPQERNTTVPAPPPEPETKSKTQTVGMTNQEIAAARGERFW